MKIPRIRPTDGFSGTEWDGGVTNSNVKSKKFLENFDAIKWSPREKLKTGHIRIVFRNGKKVVIE